jgi:hypothetical protein
MYTIYLLNQGYYLDFKTDNLDEAMIKAVDTGYDAAVCTSKSIIKVHRVIGGWS